MKKPIAKLAATGVLTLATLAGTVATAGASTPSGPPASPSASASPLWSSRIGPFPTPRICEQYVWDHNEWGIWDCEYDGHAWYAYVP